MKRYVNVLVIAIAVAIVFSTTYAYALDLPGEGETWTIPPNTTNVVEEADMAAYNALGKVVFMDETSALRFTSDTAPNVLLKGAGWMIKDSDASWTITKRQTSEWVGTWDFRAGTVIPDGTGEPLFYTNIGLHDVYVRHGATSSMVKAWRVVYANSIVHLAGRLHLGGSGSTVTLRQIEVEEDGASIYCGGTVWAQFSEVYSGGKLYNGGIKFNGHYLNVPSSSSTYPNTVLFFSDGSGKLQGPGSIRVDPSTEQIQIKSSSSAVANCTLDITDMIITSAVNICSHYYNAVADFGKFGLVRQKDSKIIMNAMGKFGSNCGGRPAYLLESGLLNAQNGLVMNGGTNAARSAYIHFRQTGGDFSASKLQVTNYISGLNADIAFGGSGTADIGSGGLHVNGDATFSFNDNVRFSLDGGIGILGGHHIWAYNGGVAESHFLASDGFEFPDGDFFAFNGGSIGNGLSTSAGDNLFGTNAALRVYERGGGISVDCDTSVIINGVDFTAPQGNVLKSVTMSDELRNNTWQTPPSVEITDSTSAGSNAAAIVDFDFDSRKVTNITVVCGGENYTAPTANLRYKSGDALLTTPLVCSTGPEESGDFTFSATNSGGRIWVQNSTNYTCKTLIVDMDQSGVADGGLDQTASNNSLILDYMENRADKPKPRFPNLTKIVVKSGAICISSSWGYNHKTTVNFLPNCYLLEMYGGHLSGGSFAVTNFTLGGTAWLTGHDLTKGASSISYGQTSPYWADLNITHETSGTKDVHVNWKSYDVPAVPGTMYVDVDATPDGVPSKLRGGTATYTTGGVTCRNVIRFGGNEADPSTLTVKNYESLRKTRARRTLLDLSDPNLMVLGTNNVVGVTPPDIAAYGEIKWSPIQRKLYWMPAGGMYLIFK